MNNMTRQQIIDTTNLFLVQDIEIDEAVLSDSASLKEDLGIDSLDFVDIVVIVEQYFGFKIKAEEMGGVKTLGQFYDYIETRINA